MGLHVFGVKINGKLGRLEGSVDDKRFEELTARGLPIGWVAWHFEDGENVENSVKAKAVYKLPVVVGGNPFWCTTIPANHTLAEPYLEHYVKTGMDLILKNF